MPRLLALLLLAPAALAGQVVPPAAPPRDTAPVAITDVTVIDVADGGRLAGQTVVIRGTRIAAVGTVTRVPVPRGARVIDGRGKFLIPGLWDVHVHSPPDPEARAVFLPLEVANGVTGVRHMWGTPAVLQQRADVAGGTLVGPRMVVGSPLVDGPRPMWRGSLTAETEADGRRLVDSLRQRGYDFVKVYQFLPRAAYFGIAGEARRRGIPFAGHVPFSVSAAEAADVGQHSIEHAMNLTITCSRAEDRLRAELAAAAADTGLALPEHFVLLARGESEPLATYDEARCAPVFAKLASNGTWVVPTLVLHRAHARLRDSATHADPRLRYMSPATRATWTAAARGGIPGAETIDHGITRVIGALRRARVGILAGTDALNPYVYPGFSLHDELALLVGAGLTPLEALRAATLDPARFLDATDSLGTVAPGQLADLVLLDADPLADIQNTRKIRAVVLNGRLLDRVALDALLA